LFYQSPTFVPGSKWKPSSHVEADAKKIEELERGGNFTHVDFVGGVAGKGLVDGDGEAVVEEVA